MLPQALPPSPVMLGFVRRGPENRVFRCPYRLENKVETSTVLLVERGAQTMSLPVSMVSNSAIEQGDFDAWAGECRRDGTNITSLSEAEEAASRIKRAHSYARLPEDPGTKLVLYRPAVLLYHGRPSDQTMLQGSALQGTSSVQCEAVAWLPDMQPMFPADMPVPGLPVHMGCPGA